MEDNIKNFKIPEFGLAGIEKKAIEVFESLAATDITSLLCLADQQSFYEEIVDAWYTVLYTRISQGRKAAPLSLLFSQAQQLLEGKLLVLISLLHTTI
jgi:hypothetical protein